MTILFRRDFGNDLKLNYTYNGLAKVYLVRTRSSQLNPKNIRNEWLFSQEISEEEFQTMYETNKNFIDKRLFDEKKNPNGVFVISKNFNEAKSVAEEIKDENTECMPIDITKLCKSDDSMVDEEMKTLNAKLIKSVKDAEEPEMTLEKPTVKKNKKK